MAPEIPNSVSIKGKGSEGMTRLGENDMRERG